MKTKLYTSLGLSLVVSLSLSIVSCDSKLDIEPRASIESKRVFTNSSNLRAALFGAYSEVKGTFNGPQNGELYGGDFNIISELISADSNVHWGGTFGEYRQFENKRVITVNSRVTANWVRAYTAINVLNNVLANLTVADTPEDRAQIEGEAKCLRGMLYFELVRLWSKTWGLGTQATDPGVPLVLTPVNTVAEADALKTIGRSTVAAVYAQVINDLEQAQTLLTPFDKNGTNVSAYAAAAMLSRVYLQQANYPKAAEKADFVIASELFELSGEPLDAFNNTANSKEDIFAIQQSTLSNAGTSNGGVATFYASLNGTGRGDMQVQEPHFNIYEDGDLRGLVQDDLNDAATITNVEDMFYIGVFSQNSGHIQTAKWGDANVNIQVIRLAEMYLTRAEANFEAGTAVGDSPVNDINVIRERAGLDPLAVVTRDEIRLERQRELAFEGFRLHDFRRWQFDINGLPFSDPSLILPIPEREREVYDIAQNEAYN